MERPAARVKKRSRVQFFFIIAIYLGLSAFRSTIGGKHKDETITKLPSPTKAPSVLHEKTLQEHHETKSKATAKENQEEKVHITPSKHHNKHSSTTLRPTPSLEEEGEEEYEEHHNISTTPSSKHHKHHNNTMPPIECFRPSIEQFPKPIMSQNVRKYGGFLFYIAATAYTFIALAVICDEFFVPSLNAICEILKISPDVAGATFMAAGSSAPELATALIGVFIAKDDIGVSGVIGSAVFNILFVISICGLFSPTAVHLNWYPLVRDCFFYMLSILALLATIADESIEWYESIMLLMLYGVYCYVMYINEVLEAWAHSLPIPLPVHVSVDEPTTVPQNENTHLVTYKAAPTDDSSKIDSDIDNKTLGAKISSFDEGANKTAGPETESILRLFERPVGGLPSKIMWSISLPLVYAFYYTIPDCRIEKWRSWYKITFAISMVWIAITSYIMVWMITVLGFTVGVPDTIMGLTFVAAGVSVPDALSSLAVLKEGHGDMAISNAVGSNVFDILVCLGLPWFLSTVVVHPGQSVRVLSRGLVYSTFSLLSTVAFLLIATHYNKWKLDRKYGVILMVWYILFMIFACLYELDVFHTSNLKECPSKY